MGIIYCYTNKNTGKKYVGQTIHPEQRKRNHIHEAFIKGSDYYFHRSLRKHGIEAFTYEILEEDVDNLDARENHYIDQFNSIWPNGYNQQYARSISLEAINKMSETKKKVWSNLPQEEKDRRIERLKTLNIGRKQTEHQKKRVAEANQKTWIVTDPNGVSSTIQNLRSWCREHNLDQGNMVRVSKGRLKHHKGYTCRQA